VCWHSEEAYRQSASLLHKAAALVLHGFDVDVVVNHQHCMPHPHPRLGAFEVKALWYDAAAFGGTSVAAAAAADRPLEVVMFSKIECKLFPDEYSVVAPLVQALCVARSRAAMGLNAQAQQQQQQQQQRQQQQERQEQRQEPVRMSKWELRLPGDVDPDLMESLLQVPYHARHAVDVDCLICECSSLCLQLFSTLFLFRTRSAASYSLQRAVELLDDGSAGAAAAATAVASLDPPPRLAPSSHSCQAVIAGCLQGSCRIGEASPPSSFRCSFEPVSLFVSDISGKYLQAMLDAKIPVPPVVHAELKQAAKVHTSGRCALPLPLPLPLPPHPITLVALQTYVPVSAPVHSASREATVGVSLFSTDVEGAAAQAGFREQQLRAAAAMADARIVAARAAAEEEAGKIAAAAASTAAGLATAVAAAEAAAVAAAAAEAEARAAAEREQLEQLMSDVIDAVE
jgi:hypothetical protein